MGLDFIVSTTLIGTMLLRVIYGGGFDRRTGQPKPPFKITWRPAAAAVIMVAAMTYQLNTYQGFNINAYAFTMFSVVAMVVFYAPLFCYKIIWRRKRNYAKPRGSNGRYGTVSWEPAGFPFDQDDGVLRAVRPVGLAIPGTAMALRNMDINPANGLPMMDGPGGLDVMGNMYGSGGQDTNPANGLPLTSGPGSPDVMGNRYGVSGDEIGPLHRTG